MGEAKEIDLDVLDHAWSEFSASPQPNAGVRARDVITTGLGIAQDDLNTVRLLVVARHFDRSRAPTGAVESALNALKPALEESRGSLQKRTTRSPFKNARLAWRARYEPDPAPPDPKPSPPPPAPAEVVAHRHTVTVSPADFAALAAGGTVTLATTIGPKLDASIEVRDPPRVDPAEPTPPEPPTPVFASAPAKATGAPERPWRPAAGPTERVLWIWSGRLIGALACIGLTLNAVGSGHPALPLLLAASVVNVHATWVGPADAAALARANYDNDNQTVAAMNLLAWVLRQPVVLWLCDDLASSLIALAAAEVLLSLTWWQQYERRTVVDSYDVTDDPAAEYFRDLCVTYNAQDHLRRSAEVTAGVTILAGVAVMFGDDVLPGHVLVYVVTVVYVALAMRNEGKLRSWRPWHARNNPFDGIVNRGATPGGSAGGPSA